VSKVFAYDKQVGLFCVPGSQCFYLKRSTPSYIALSYHLQDLNVLNCSHVFTHKLNRAYYVKIVISKSSVVRLSLSLSSL